MENIVELNDMQNLNWGVFVRLLEDKYLDYNMKTKPKPILMTSDNTDNIYKRIRKTHSMNVLNSCFHNVF